MPLSRGAIIALAISLAAFSAADEILGGAKDEGVVKMDADNGGGGAGKTQKGKTKIENRLLRPSIHGENLIIKSD